MTIYNIFDHCTDEESRDQETAPPWQDRIDPEALFHNAPHHTAAQDTSPARDRILSACAARFFFLLLLMADLLWGAYCVMTWSIKLALNCCTLFRVQYLRERLKHSWLNLKRSIVCGMALFVALFSPALGIMFSCMYFLMYDKSGVEEVVPASLQEQFQQIFKQ